MIRVERYLGRRFHWRSYNCWHFVAEVLSTEMGIDIGVDRVPDRITQESLLKAILTHREAFRRLSGPEDTCLVLLWPRVGTEAHIGIFYRNRLLHLTKGGAAYEPIDRFELDYKEPQFYACDVASKSSGEGG